MTDNTIIDVGVVFEYLLSTGLKRGFLPSPEYLNLPKYKEVTSQQLQNGIKNATDVFYVTENLIQLWYPGLTAAGCDITRVWEEIILPLDAKIVNVMITAGYPETKESEQHYTTDDDLYCD